MCRKITEEQRERNRIRERNRYKELHKNYMFVCKVCGKPFSKIDRPGTTKTCSTECQKLNKKLRDKCRKQLTEPYFINNRAKILEYNKNWRKTTVHGKEIMKRADNKPERKLIKKLRTHRNRQNGIIMPINVDELIKISNLDRICVVCHTEDDLTLDHIISLSKGGLNVLENLQILCRKHNSQKHNKTMEEYIIWLNNKNIAHYY